MKKVLLTTDFSDNARSAIVYALKLFGSENVTYTLLNTYKEPGSAAAAMVSITEYLHKESENLLAKDVAYWNSEYPEHAIEGLSLHGSLYPVINSLARKEMADIVVVGTHGASQVQNFFLGSNTMDVLKHAQLPAIIVPQGYSFQAIDKIALAIDFKPLKVLDILAPITSLAKRKSAKISAFHIQENESDTMNIDSPEVQRLFEYCGSISHEFNNVKNDNIAAGIGSYMQNSGAELLAVVARKHNFMERLFQKSITKEVSLLASFPMIVVREK